MSELSVGQLKGLPVNNNIITIPSGHKLYAPGTPVQVVSKTFSDVTGTSVYQAYIEVTNGDLAITSKFSNSKFLVRLSAQGYVNGGDGFNIGINRAINGTTTRVIGVDGSGGDSWQAINHSGDTSMSWTASREALDSPGVPAGTIITYKALVGHWSGSNSIWMNYSGYSGGSTITVIEVAA